MKTNILMQDKVESTITIINQYLKMALHQAQTKNPKFVYYILKGNTVEQVIDYITVRNAKSALVVDDLGLQIINRLLQEGVTDITLCLTRFPKDLMPAIKYIIFNSFPSIKINIIHYEEISMIQNVDLIISNPAYGPIGANITYKIKDQVTYREFINLLPANDYKRNTDKNLFNFQSDMIPVNDGFEDASVTTHLARIHNTKVNDITLEDFERSQYIDPQLDKYFKNTFERTCYLEHNYNAHGNCSYANAIVTNTICFGEREFSHKHLPYGKDTNSYRWNVEESISELTVDCTGKCRYIFIKFETAIEKRNCVDFMYSKNGFRFMSKLLTAMNKDGYDVGYFMPKVDWTRSWTVEEILADYGYTEDEIIEVMADLKNFRGMEN